MARKRFITLALVAVAFCLVAAAPAGATTFDFVHSFGGSGAAANGTHFVSSQWIAIDPNPTPSSTDDPGNHWVYVSDTTGNRIKRFNLDGTAANFGSSSTNIIGQNYIGTGTCGDSPSVCFSSPAGVAVDASHNLFVADNNFGEVVEFDSTGTFVREFGGSDTGGFDSGGGAGTDNLGVVTGIAVNSSGHVLVGDNSHGRVVEFDPANATNALGGFIRQFGTENLDPDLAAADQFTDLQGVAVDSSDNVYMTDAQIHRVSKWDSTANHTQNWGTHGTALGQFNDPEGIVFTPDDGNKTPASIFVVDFNNQRVEQFTPTGGNVAQFGSQGGNNGQFLAPIGIAAVNQTGSGTNLFVADSQSNMIQQFAPEQPPTNTAVPQVTGNAVAGDTLTTDNGSWTNNPVPPFVYDWQRCDSGGSNCADIPGATNQNYQLTSDDISHTVRSCVTAHNNAGSSSAACSTTTAVVTAPPSPVNTAAPTISGTAAQGRQLTIADNGTWSNNPTSFSDQWQRCDSAGNNCSDIGGATNSVYTLTGDDVGGKVRVVVTAHNANPTATSAPSSPSDVVVGAPASPSPGPSISGTPKSGETLTADRGTWPNDAANSYAYQWERCDSGGGNCADIAGATDQTFTLSPSEVGFTLRVRVTASNAAVPTTSATSDPTAVVKNVAGGTKQVTTVGGSQAGVPTGSNSPNTSTVQTIGVPIAVATVPGASVKAVLLIDKKTAKKVHLGNGKHAVVVGHPVNRKTSNGDVKEVLKLTKKAKKALRKLKSYRLTIQITITDAKHHKFIITRKVTVKHKK